MSEPARPRPRPCVSCPYRRDVPSGVWAAEEYDKLPGYDGDTACQRLNLFMCHQGDGLVCSGWLGHRDPYELLAVRFGVIDGRLDESALDYTTDVALFGSGAEAAAHGRRNIDNPPPDTVAAIGKVARVRAARGVPVEGSRP